MTKEEFIEQLADKEHASWARWQRYMFSKCLDMTAEYVHSDDREKAQAITNLLSKFEGAIIIFPESVEHWKRQIDTPYAELSEREKQSDREEVAHILPIINEYVRGDTTAYEKLTEEQKTTVNEFRTRISNTLFENLEQFYQKHPDLVFSWGLTLNVSLREDQQEPQEL